MKILNCGYFRIFRDDVKFSQIHGIDKDNDLLIKILPFGSVLGKITSSNYGFSTFSKPIQTPKCHSEFIWWWILSDLAGRSIFIQKPKAKGCVV